MGPSHASFSSTLRKGIAAAFSGCASTGGSGAYVLVCYAMCALLLMNVCYAGMLCYCMCLCATGGSGVYVLVCVSAAATLCAGCVSAAATICAGYVSAAATMCAGCVSVHY